MSGHSKWAGIKHKKAIIDAKRGKLFSKLVKDVTLAARSGGDLNVNAALRTAVARAKEANVPADNLERAIKRGTGQLPGVSFEEITYEGYGPGGVAVMVEVLTDNKNRTSAEIRNIFTKGGGNLAGTGSVSWMFSKKGFIVVNKKAIDEDKLMDIVSESGGEDIDVGDTTYDITTAVCNFESVKASLRENNISTEVEELTMVPSSYVSLEKNRAQQVLLFMELLEEQDDVQNVYANFDIPDELVEGK